MNGTELIYGAIAATAFALGVISRVIIAWRSGAVAAEKFDTYKSYAIIAAKWVERIVPDDYGASAEDSTTTKSLHKLDLFLRKYTELLAKCEGVSVNDALRSEAVRWSATLAGRVSSDPMAPIAAGAAVETIAKKLTRADYR